jgi:aminomethyltransferase
VTSGNFSPMLEHGIALALVDSAVDPVPGQELELEQRGKTRTATVVATPFVRPGQFASPS